MKWCDITLSGVPTETQFQSVQKHVKIFFTYQDLLPQLSLYFTYFFILYHKVVSQECYFSAGELTLTHRAVRK